MEKTCLFVSRVELSVQMTLGKFPGLNLLLPFSMKVTFKQASDIAFQNTRGLMTNS